MDDYYEGFALYFILILIIAGSVFVLTLYRGAFINIKLSNNLTYQKKAFYAAESAIAYSKAILEENKGIPLKNEKGNSYLPGDIYEEREIYGNANFKFKFFLVEENPKIYKIEIQGIYNRNTCRINVQYNDQFQLIKYKKIAERSL
ncbi:MAG: pilus assembly PilX N-terminal domain-containing protein [Bacillota bacterium]